jgi:hypothetical protein
MRRLAGIVAAATLGAPASAQDWAYSGSIYGWFSGLGSTIETPRGTVETELDFSEVLELLDFAAFGAFEARRGEWGFIADLAYSRLSAVEETPFGDLFDDAVVGSELTLVTGYAAYRAFEAPEAAIDVGAGIRFGSIDLGIDLDGNLAPDQSFGLSGTWADPVVAARIVVPFNDRWYGKAFADVGGFGFGDASDLTWQAYASVGYRFNERWSTELGYRHFRVERDLEGRDLELSLSGVLVGVTARF